MKKVLVSHSWTTPESHSEISGLLERAGYEFIDRSVLPSEPLGARSEADLKRQLSGRISEVSTVLFAATEDAHRKPLVQYEIKECIRQGKRLVAVQPLGSSGKPVPQIIDDHAHAIVGFRSENIVSAIEGEDIRNYRSYVTAEADDKNRTAHAIARCACAALMVGVLTREQWLPPARQFLKDRGYILVQSAPEPTQEQVVGNMLLAGLLGLAAGVIVNGRWAVTLALCAGAVAGAYTIGRNISVTKTLPYPAPYYPW